jgi:hypothetical protein
MKALVESPVLFWAPFHFEKRRFLSNHKILGNQQFPLPGRDWPADGSHRTYCIAPIPAIFSDDLLHLLLASKTTFHRALSKRFRSESSDFPSWRRVRPPGICDARSSQDVRQAGRLRGGIHAFVASCYEMQCNVDVKAFILFKNLPVDRLGAISFEPE